MRGEEEEEEEEEGGRRVGAQSIAKRRGRGESDKNGGNDGEMFSGVIG